MKKSLKYLLGIVLGISVLLPIGFIVLYLTGYMLESISTSIHMTHKPKQEKLVEFNQNLGPGSFVFSVQKQTNGSQSTIVVPYIWVVLAIEDDYVVVARVLLEQGGEQQEMQAYSRLLNSINKEDVGVITEAAGNKYFSLIEIKQYIVSQSGKPNPSLPYAFACNSWRPFVLSKSALLKKGEFSSYLYDMDSYSGETFKHGYVAEVSPANAKVIRLCEHYRNTWLHDLKESRNRYFSSKAG